MKAQPLFRLFICLVLFPALILGGCLPEPALNGAGLPVADTPAPVVEGVSANPLPKFAEVTPYPTRPIYQAGELVDYTAQTGDMLPSLAARFNTTVDEIRAANPIIPDSATTMPPGMPMKIPIYYRPLWGNPYRMIPDSQFINGPAARGFSSTEFVNGHNGWLKNYSEYVIDRDRTGAETIDVVAEEYSISPRVLIALAEYMTGALSNATPPAEDDTSYQGRIGGNKSTGLYNQLSFVADVLNDGYYGFRGGTLLEHTLSDGRLERIDPWQNAATVAFQYYFNTIFYAPQYESAISDTGFGKTYVELFGDPWASDQPHMPGSLMQPEFRLPFESGKTWAFTGGPHNAWGETDEPLAAIDFAPPAKEKGCIESPEWAVAVADGIIARKSYGIAVLDLDGDGDERTGWVVFYLHLRTGWIPPVGTLMKTGDRISHPSCDGGKSTGTHVHMARKYNGEWILADSRVPFNLDGWVVQYGGRPYSGSLFRNGRTVVACTCSDQGSQIQSSK